MVVSDTTIYILMANALIYLLAYRRNAFLGSIFFLVVGIGIFSKLASGDGWIGLVMLLAGLLGLVYEVASTNRKIANAK